MWEFNVKREFESEFEKLYGPEGEWARLFRKGEGYLGTELFRDVIVEGRYVTIDYWSSRAAYEAFRGRFRDAYEQLDDHCALLTEKEVRLGEFSCSRAITKHHATEIENDMSNSRKGANQ
jgi:heme-degrading monooxygenase HmoA